MTPTIKQPLTIVMSGGHTIPLVATVQALKRAVPSSTIVVGGRDEFGTERTSIEEDEVTRVGARFVAISFGKMHRYPTIRQIPELLKIPRGVMQALRLIRSSKPDAIVTFGGYLSLPFAWWAQVLRIPLVVHEQTSVWGAANRIARRWASVATVSWPHMVEPGIVLVGNPMPEEVRQAENAPDPRRPVVLVMGGSQGSEAIDRVAEPILASLVRHADVYHQSRRRFASTSPRYHWARWFPTPEFAALLRRTSVAVSRAGANTVTVLAHLGIPSILIPLPHSAGGEQMRNALLIADTGLARVLLQRDVTPDVLLQEVDSMLMRGVDAHAKQRARGLVNPDAASDLATTILKVANR